MMLQTKYQGFMPYGLRQEDLKKKSYLENLFLACVT